MSVLESSILSQSTDRRFSAHVQFLELNDEPVAYALVLQYKNIAFITKTSYDLRFERLNVGIYVQNVAIHHLFEAKEVTHIDFLTDLSYMGR